MKTIFKLWICLALTCVLAGCGPRYVDFFPCYDDGTAKPTVALVPVVNSSECDIPWDLSQELTEGIRNRLCNKGDLYLPPEKEVQPIIDRLGNVDYFGKNLAFTKQFNRYEFVAFVEVLEHSVIPYDSGKMEKLLPGQDCNSVLVTRVRLRVVDVQCDSPKVILQEIVRGEYKIPAGMEDLDYCHRCWGSEEYRITPYNRAHQRLIENISARLEEATWSVR